MVLKSRLSVAGREKKGPFKNLEREKNAKNVATAIHSTPHFTHTQGCTHTHGAKRGVFVSPRRHGAIFGVIVISRRLQSERTKHRNRLISQRKRRTEREREGRKERG